MQSMSATLAGIYTNVLTNTVFTSAIGKHLKNDHGIKTIGNFTSNFSVLKKYNGKLDCLIYEMQSDSIRAKLFV